MIFAAHKFIFVHIYKVAGTSVKQALRPYSHGMSRPKRIANKISRRITGENFFKPYEQPLDGHATASDYKRFLGEAAYGRHFKFAFVRNPFDWQVSLYEYVRQTPHHHLHDFYMKMSFEEFIAWRCSEDRVLQRDFVQEDGKTIVDFIGRFENLEDDFREALSRVGLRAELTHINQSRRTNYRSYYNDQTRALVSKAFAEDFELFGYDKAL